ncbi:MAG TPA: response regulator, partial [bacterium]
MSPHLKDLIRGPLHILTVEDSATDAELLAIALAGEFPAGQSVTWARTLEQALECLHHGAFDVLLMDLSLPDSSGLDGIRRIRGEWPHVPIVIVTGTLDEELAAAAVDLGVQDYLLKGRLTGRIVSRVIMYAILRQRAEEMMRRANVELEDKVRQRTAQLRELASELILAEQRERRRMAVRLHDHLQQILVGARLGLGMLQMSPKGQPLRAELHTIEDQVGAAIEASRSLTAEISAPVLYEGSFAAALRWLAQQMRAEHGLQVVVQAQEDANVEDESVRVLLFQSVRELLLNVVKHAGTDRAQVRLGHGARDCLSIEVSDEGRGFDGGLPDAGKKESLGLFGIRARLDQLGGGML